ncbi:helix-turn-helix domain-containing protein [Actinopolyspora alba]|uniref:helix-turn-helix domain-containing protein n=1 Tax=Actinopolyspora alba TaxID=673379 RepID=UPI000A5F5EBE|nr:helix-turn-helix transcriptional regulator [Actinopolyspora alba]
MAQSRATIERRQLGAELRRLREGAGKSQKEAADVIECDASLISRLERGQASLKIIEIESLLDYFHAPSDSREQIKGLAQAARQRKPRRVYSDGLPGAFRRLLDHEQDATEIYYADSELIPGLLQHEDYIRAMMRSAEAITPNADREDSETHVRFRLERQELLERTNPPLIWFVIGEAALRRPIGSQRILQSQLEHLLAMVERHPHVVVQVVPLNAVDHPLLGGPIEILRFGDTVPDIVHQPTFIGAGVYVVEQRDIDECTRAFDRLRAIALGPQESQDFIARHVKELGHGHG